MGFTVVYVFSVLPALESLVRGSFPELAELLLERVVWSKREGGRTAWQPEDYVAQVKAAWIMHVLRMLEEAPAGSDVARDLFGPSVPIEVHCFDRWWCVDRIEIDESFEDVDAGITSADAMRVRVDQSELARLWLNKERPSA